MSGETQQPFQGIASFGRARITRDLAGVDVAILGAPFDGTVSYRSGTRFGPRALREQSLLLWGYHNALSVAPFDVLQLVDYGDANVVPPSVIETHGAIERDIAAMVAAGVKPILLGGEHSVSLPALRALAKQHGPMAVLHFDAHPDTWNEEYAGHKFSHGTPFVRALEEGLIDREAYVQLGIRGPTYGPQDYAEARALGARLITMDEIRQRGLPAVIDEARQRVGARPVYVTFDIDVVDPAFAPGTGTPEPGGLSSYEALRMVRSLTGLNVVGGDLVEVSPPYDPTGITAILGANLVFDLLAVMALRKQSLSS